MHRITLARGLEVPTLGFGTFQLAGEEAYEGVRTALEVGYRHIDTAQGYDNEREVGTAIADSDVDRSEVFLTTKIRPDNAAAGDVRSSTLQSLDALGVDHVDLLLLHWPAEDTAPLEETLSAMTQLWEGDVTRAIGVSNFPSAMLSRALELAPVVTDQVEHHPFLAVDRIRKVLREHDGFLTAYSPLARGEVMDDETLTAIAEEHDVSPAQVTLRWMLQQGDVVAIPKSATPERIRSNFDVFGFELRDDELARITALDEGRRLIDPDIAPDWD
jgi:2,5-diketo-D-gluconate reductase B